MRVVFLTEMTTTIAKMMENGAQLFARLDGRRSLKDIEPHIFPDGAGPVQGDVVEFHGTEGSGKTETLFHLVSHCILPVDRGGLEVEVMFVDTDYHFDMLRLVTVLERRLGEEAREEDGVAAAESEVQVRACLARLYVVHCSTSVQLLLTLHHLESTFCSRPALCLLVIDSISAFYWVDRSGGGESVAKQEANLRRCSELLERLLRDCRIVVFATTHAIMRNYRHSGQASTASLTPAAAETSSSSSWRQWSSTHASDFDRPYLSRAWQRLVTHRLLFSKGEVTQDKKQLFSAACTTTRTVGAKCSSFCVMEGGVQFL
ncbi:DNA repair protein XRCC2 [Esox lucius]|uniref:RecA family profile 1 domain-containing protein n=1 Tax=Esox lucius TaxID=8010 RepID=A0AAY5KN93_ESOLU|nr:DNA repair protein XRCC2 [Esox lucius]